MLYFARVYSMIPMQYMAPEVVLYKPYGKPVDIYSFALTVWETMNMKTPFEAMNFEKLSNDILRKEKRPTIPRDWPKEMSEMLNRAWATDPSDRPTADEFCKFLYHVLDDTNEEC